MDTIKSYFVPYRFDLSQQKIAKGSIQLTAITIVTVMAPRWLERHEQSFITLATIIQVRTSRGHGVQGFIRRGHIIRKQP